MQQDREAPRTEIAPHRTECGRRAFAPTRAEATRLGSWLLESALPFGVILYLALRGGGYDVMVRGEVAIGAWLIGLLGAIIGFLPRCRLTRGAWLTLGLLAAFAAWTALAAIWSESVERSLEEAARVSAYLGIFALAIVVQRRGAWPRTLGAVAAAIGVVGALALLSRLHPAWFPTDELAQSSAADAGRLGYPLNYWNGVAALIAMGAPLMISVATHGRRRATQALATAALPILALACFYTYSRVGPVAGAVALLVLLAFHPRRLDVLVATSPAVVGSAFLIVAAAQREALQDGTTTAVSHRQGDEMLVLVLVVCTVVALLRVAISRRYASSAFARIRISRSLARRILATATVVLVVGAVIGGLPGQLSNAWDNFKSADNSSGAARFESVSGNGRYEYWQSALDANATAPMIGIGPGTFEFWWSREGTLPGFTRYAHSLYLQTLAEAGVVGLMLIGGLIVAALALGVRRTRAAPVGERGLLAGGLGAAAAFAVAAGLDWLWHIPVIPLTFLLIVSVLVSAPAQRAAAPEGLESENRRGRGRTRLALIALGVPSLIVLAVSVVGASFTSFMREYRTATSPQELEAVAADARTAERIQPYAGTPYLQESLALEQLGRLPEAVRAAREAAEKEPTNWRPWLALTRIETELGDRREAVNAASRARALNPRSLEVISAYGDLTGDYSVIPPERGE
jgi:hypothetical protein